jgi:ectoine hydroxylase-related dioxygenase (phytanoyl-CoA dioxygenase family)
MKVMDVKWCCGSLANEGFTIVEGAIPAASVSEMRLALHSLLLDRASNWEMELETVVPRIVERHRLFRRLALDHLIREVVCDVMGPDVHLVLNQGHLKPARTRAHTAVHSDLLHLRGVDHSTSLLMIKCMVALSPIGPGDGGLSVFPRSHRVRYDAYPPQMRGDSTYITMKAGDAVFFNAGMMHSATNNDSDRPRLSLWLAYAHTWMRQLPGFEPSPEFLADVASDDDPYARQIFGLNEPYATGAAVALSVTDH